MSNALALTAAVPALLERLDDDAFLDLPEPVTRSGRALLAAQAALDDHARRWPTDPYTGRRVHNGHVERLIEQAGDGLGRGMSVDDLGARIVSARLEEAHADEVGAAHRTLVERWRSAWGTALRQHADEVVSGTLRSQHADILAVAADLPETQRADGDLVGFAAVLERVRYLHAEVLLHAGGSDRVEAAVAAGAGTFPGFAERWPAWGDVVLRRGANATPPPWPSEPVPALRYALGVECWLPTTSELLDVFNAAERAWRDLTARREQEANLARLRAEMATGVAHGLDFADWHFQRSPFGAELLAAGLIKPAQRRSHILRADVTPLEPVRFAPAVGGDGQG